MKKGKYYCEVEIYGWDWWPQGDECVLDEAVGTRYILLPDGITCGYDEDDAYEREVEDNPREWKFFITEDEETTFDKIAAPKAEDFIEVIMHDHKLNKNIFPSVTSHAYIVRDDKKRLAFYVICENDKLHFKWFDNERNVIKREVYEAK